MPFYRFLRFYNGVLHRHKYPVQIATGGLLWLAGDILAQGASSLAQPADNDAPFRVDWQRTGRMTLYGVCISAPAYAFWYSFLDRASHRLFRHPPAPLRLPANALARRLVRRLPPAMTTSVDGVAHLSPLTVRTWNIIGFKLLADGLLFDPLYLSLFFTATGLLEGRTPPEIAHKLRQDLLRTYLVDVLVWTPVQTVNFRFVPVAYQALVVQSCNVAWNAYLSFVQHHP